MTPRAAIAMLDRQIKANGQSAELRRFDDAGKKSAHPLRVFLRGYVPNELGGGIDQGDSAVVISATDWGRLDVGTLPERLDQLHVGGRLRTIENVDPVYIDDVLVRINVQVRG